MKQKISRLSAPVLAAAIRERNERTAIAVIKSCVLAGADMIDLHMSCLDSTDTETLKSIISSTKLPVLALNYNQSYEWRAAGFSEDERIATFLRAAEAGAAGVDIQGYTFHLPSKDGFCGEDKYSFTKGNPKEIVTDEEIISKQCELIERVHSMGVEVLLSCHPGIPMTSEQVVELALFLEKRKPGIIKIVTVANTEEELMESIKTMLLLKKEIRTPVSYHAGGAKGALSRIVNPLIGGHIAFCVENFSENNHPEQLDLRTAKRLIEDFKGIMEV